MFSSSTLTLDTATAPSSRMPVVVDDERGVDRLEAAPKIETPACSTSKLAFEWIWSAV